MLGFTRIETSALTGINYDRLNYLTKRKLLVPRKVGQGNRGMYFYEWNQIILLMHIRDYKDFISLDNVEFKSLEDIFKGEELFYSGVLTKVIFVMNNEEYGLFIIAEENSLGYNGFLEKFRTGLKETGAKSHRYIFGDESKILINDDKLRVKHVTLCTPISEYVEEIINNARNSNDIDFKDFLRRANLESFVKDSESNSFVKT